jgi:hypothetical protein
MTIKRSPKHGARQGLRLPHFICGQWCCRNRQEALKASVFIGPLSLSGYVTGMQSKKDMQ